LVKNSDQELAWKAKRAQHWLPEDSPDHCREALANASLELQGKPFDEYDPLTLAEVKPHLEDAGKSLLARDMELAYERVQTLRGDE
jgi:hypothetical protein